MSVFALIHAVYDSDRSIPQNGALMSRRYDINRVQWKKLVCQFAGYGLALIRFGMAKEWKEVHAEDDGRDEMAVQDC